MRRMTQQQFASLASGLGPAAQGMAARTANSDIQMMSLVADISQKAVGHMRELEEVRAQVLAQGKRIDELEAGRSGQLAARVQTLESGLAEQKRTVDAVRARTAQLEGASASRQSSLDEFFRGVATMAAQAQQQARADTPSAEPEAASGLNAGAGADANAPPTTPRQHTARAPARSIIIKDVDADTLTEQAVEEWRRKLASLPVRYHPMRSKTNEPCIAMFRGGFQPHQEAAKALRNRRAGRSKEDSSPYVRMFHIFGREKVGVDHALYPFRATARSLQEAKRYRDRVLQKLGCQIEVKSTVKSRIYTYKFEDV